MTLAYARRESAVQVHAPDASPRERLRDAEHGVRSWHVRLATNARRDITGSLRPLGQERPRNGEAEGPMLDKPLSLQGSPKEDHRLVADCLPPGSFRYVFDDKSDLMVSAPNPIRNTATSAGRTSSFAIWSRAPATSPNTASNSAAPSFRNSTRLRSPKRRRAGERTVTSVLIVTGLALPSAAASSWTGLPLLSKKVT